VGGAEAPRGRAAWQAADLRGNRIALAKRAGQRRGWTTEVFELYGKRAKKRYNTFEATWRPAGGLIRVVLVDEPGGWVAFFCTEGGQERRSSMLLNRSSSMCSDTHHPQATSSRRSPSGDGGSH
jgi:hypothetical protein